MFFKGLISPKTRKPLQVRCNSLVTEDGQEVFAITEGVAYLLSSDNLDKLKQQELHVFDNIEIKDVSYFRKNLFNYVLNKVNPFLKEKTSIFKRDFKIVELGGGEGHWASYAYKEIPNSAVYVCDLSFNTLKRAPKILQRICADVSRPIFERNSIHLATFWVSLHHLKMADRKKALNEIACDLVEEGLLIIFEPNIKFWPRQVMYRSRFRHDVYIDEKEQALDFSEISEICKDLGLIEVTLNFMNPPYNINFLKKLKKWIIYLCAVEFLYRLDKWIFNPIFGGVFSNHQNKLKKYLTLYGLAIYRKERKL